MDQTNYSSQEVENNGSPLGNALLLHLGRYYPNKNKEEDKEYKEGAD